MATVQSYTKSGVDAKFNLRSNMTMVHNGGGSPDISAYPDSKTGDVIERSSDGARWSVVASTINPIAGRVVSVAGKTGVVTLGPGDVGAAPSSHTHTKAQITDLNASTSATENSIAQRGIGGVLVVGTPTTTTHAATKAYVDSRITGGITWSNLSGKPSTFAPSAHNHTVSQITDLTVAVGVDANTVVKRTSGGQIEVQRVPTALGQATSKDYVDTQVTASKAWAAITGKPESFKSAPHSHPYSEVTGLVSFMNSHTHTSSSITDSVSNITGSSTNSGTLLSLSSTGRLTAVNPSGSTDVANKQYVDSEILAKTTWDNTSGKPSTFPPSSHTHTVAQITDLTLSQSATGSAVVQRDSSGRATVATPTSTGHATTKAYVDNAVTASKAWSAITGKPESFKSAPHSHPTSEVTGLVSFMNSHNHTVSQITDLNISVGVNANNVVRRTSSGQIEVALTPAAPGQAASKQYVDSQFGATNLSTLDLDSVTDAGNYHQPTSSSATTDRNYPEGSSTGQLIVTVGGSYIKQEYTDARARSIHYRTRYQNIWYPWQSISQTTA